MHRDYEIAFCKRIDNELFGYREFTTVPNGQAFWAADPFPIEHEGILYIFAELFFFKSMRGVIGYTKLEGGSFKEWKVIISEPYHLSFPNIFKLNGSYYMCPEANESKEIYLYKCISFPDKWEKDRVIASGDHFTDTVFTLIEDETIGFTYRIANNKKNNDELKMFKIVNDRAIFSSGKLNVINNYSSRPGGKVITNGDKKIMVAQIGKPFYGSGLSFKEFSVCWPDYFEKEVSRILPSEIKTNKNRKYIGIHTYNLSTNYLVIDLIFESNNLIETVYRGFNKITSGMKRT